MNTLYPVSLVAPTTRSATTSTATMLIADFKADAQAAYDRREESLTPEVMRELERRVLLTVLDRKWREHLYEMDYLREGIGLRAMAQRDPLVEYQREGGDMFNAMMEAFMEEVVGFVFHLEVQVEPTPAAVGRSRRGPGRCAADGRQRQSRANGHSRSNGQRLIESGPDPDGPGVELHVVGDDFADTRTRREPDEIDEPEPRAGGGPAVRQGEGPGRTDSAGGRYSAPGEDGEAERSGSTATDADDPYARVGRNAPCPCGSGKKFKMCHGRAAQGRH